MKSRTDLACGGTIRISWRSLLPVILGEIFRIFIAALTPVCTRLRHVTGTQWGNNKYMNMKQLEASVEDASIAG